MADVLVTHVFTVGLIFEGKEEDNSVEQCIDSMSADATAHAVPAHCGLIIPGDKT